MAIKSDPEKNETRALFDLVDFSGRRVLEVGCGDGRLTRRYAAKAAHVTGIDPFAQGIARAREKLPVALRQRVEFRDVSVTAFASEVEPSLFDTIILSWSL